MDHPAEERRALPRPQEYPSRAPFRRHPHGRVAETLRDREDRRAGPPGRGRRPRRCSTRRPCSSASRRRASRRSWLCGPSARCPCSSSKTRAPTLRDRARRPFDVDGFLELALRLAEISPTFTGATSSIGTSTRRTSCSTRPGPRRWSTSTAPRRARRSRLIRTRSSAGPLAYASPEQLGRTNRVIDARSDLYSLGTVLYEMLTGAPPFRSDDPLEIVHAHLAKLPVSPTVVAADVPRQLSGIVLKLLSKMPEARYQTAAALAADLGEARERWRKARSIEPFELGSVDLALELPLPERLYGRDEELAALQGGLRSRRDGPAGARARRRARPAWARARSSCALRRSRGSRARGQVAAAEVSGRFIAGKFDLPRDQRPVRLADRGSARPGVRAHGGAGGASGRLEGPGPPRDGDNGRVLTELPAGARGPHRHHRPGWRRSSPARRRRVSTSRSRHSCRRSHPRGGPW